MNNLNNIIQSLLRIDSSETMHKLFTSMIVIFVLWAIRTVISSIIRRRTDDIRIQYFWRKTVSYLTAFIGVIVVLSIWFEGIQDFTTFLGLLSAGVAIALRDIFTNIAGWLFIMWVRPVSVGDRIQIGDNRGDVVDISLFHITLMEIGNWVSSDQSTGRIIKIPNGQVFTHPLANYSQGFQYIWNEIPVLVTFESNWQKAKEILLDISQRHTEHLTEAAEMRVREAGKRFLIYYSKLTPTVYTSVRESGVLLTIRYLCEPRRRRGTEETIWEDTLRAFSEHEDIDLAYPTTRFYRSPDGLNSDIPTDLRK